MCSPTLVLNVECWVLSWWQEIIRKDLSYDYLFPREHSAKSCEDGRRKFCAYSVCQPSFGVRLMEDNLLSQYSCRYYNRERYISSFAKDDIYVFLPEPVESQDSSSFDAYEIGDVYYSLFCVSFSSPLPWHDTEKLYIRKLCSDRLLQASAFTKPDQQLRFLLVLGVRIYMLYQRPNREDVSSCPPSGESNTHQIYAKIKKFTKYSKTKIMIKKRRQKPISNFWFSRFGSHGRLAQLVRALARHARGHRFESRIDHHRRYQKIITYIFPRYCIHCKALWEYLCVNCKRLLHTHREICPVSHRFSPDFLVHLDYRNEVSYEGIVIWFEYDALLKKLIFALKYHHRYALSSFLIDRLTLVIQSNHTLYSQFYTKKTIIAPIPSHWYRKHFTKGYNQSELLARWVAQKLSLSYQPLLVKTAHTRAQALLSRQQRMRNIAGVFAIRKDVTLCWNELVVLVDDVTTTGATIQSAAQELKKHHPKLVIREVVLGRHV